MFQNFKQKGGLKVVISIYGIEPIAARILLERMKKMAEEKDIRIGMFDPSPADNYDPVPSLSIVYEEGDSAQVEAVKQALTEYGIDLPVRTSAM